MLGGGLIFSAKRVCAKLSQKQINKRKHVMSKFRGSSRPLPLFSFKGDVQCPYQAKLYKFIEINSTPRKQIWWRWTSADISRVTSWVLLITFFAVLKTSLEQLLSCFAHTTRMLKRFWSADFQVVVQSAHKQIFEVRTWPKEQLYVKKIRRITSKIAANVP